MANKTSGPNQRDYFADPARLAALSAYRIMNTPSEPAFDAIVELAARVCATPIAAISLIDDRCEWIKAQQGIGTQALPLGNTLCAYTTCCGEALVIPDLNQDERFQDYDLNLGGKAVRFYAGFPLFSREGLCLGTLCVADHVPREIQPEHLQILSALARAVVAELELRRSRLESKQPEQQDASHGNEQQLRLITDALPALVSYVDAEQRFRFNNRTYEEWFGYSRAEMYGKHLRDVIGPQYEKRRQYIERALAGERVSYEAVVCDKDGTRHDVHIDYIPDVDTQGVVHGFVTQIWDMTSIKQVQGTLQNLEQDYRALIDSIEGIVWEADASSFQFTFVSAQAERLLGYPVSQWVEETDFWPHHIHPEDRQEVIESCLESTANRRNNDLEYRMVASDGRVVWLRDIVSVRIENGVPKLRGVMIDITGQKNAEQQLNYLTNYDALTDLPNRNLFVDRLERALAYSNWHKRPLAVLAIGIRRMKRINESLGREAGDKLLVNVAERLRSVLRSRDTIARLSGNEFAILLADMSRETDVGRILEKLTEGLAQPFKISGHDIVPAIRIGISMPYGDEINARDMLNNAETAMHQVESMQGVSFQHYSRSLGEQIANVLTVEKALQRALIEEKLELHYQPQVELGSGKITSVEALLRWTRPDGVTRFEPADFIPLAEESGLIIPIGKWILQRACRDYQTWQKQGVAPASIAINMSARQFEDPAIVEEIRHELRQYSMRPGQLELELTENVVQSATSAKQIQSLARIGVQIAIDDFGTGYSSLNYLKHLPVQKLKVDRSFMRGVPQATDNVAIVKAIIAMGHSMGLTVAAEGVETAAQRRYLRTQGCDLGQGHLFSRPIPSEKLLELLARSSRPT